MRPQQRVLVVGHGLRRGVPLPGCARSTSLWAASLTTARTRRSRAEPPPLLLQERPRCPGLGKPTCPKPLRSPQAPRKGQNSRRLQRMTLTLVVTGDQNGRVAALLGAPSLGDSCDGDSPSARRATSCLGAAAINRSAPSRDGGRYVALVPAVGHRIELPLLAFVLVYQEMI